MLHAAAAAPARPHSLALSRGRQPRGEDGIALHGDGSKVQRGRAGKEKEEDTSKEGHFTVERRQAFSKLFPHLKIERSTSVL